VKGLRVQPDENGYPRKLHPGEYVRVAPLRAGDGREFSEEERRQWWNKPYWMACSPNGHACTLSAHIVVEHEDGTITVSPSILISTYREGRPVEVYHGWLERGVWRDA
jgi:hypothetical protein